MLRPSLIKPLLILAALCLGANTAAAEVRGHTIDYQIGNERFTGYLAYDDAIQGPRPGVLVVHEWWGHNAYARKRADMLAALGYTAFALDMYGSSKLADHPETAKAFMQAATGNLETMRARFMAGLNILKSQPQTDTHRLAAIGYCMGGGIVLNMARSGIDLAAVAIFHGSLGAATTATPGSIKPRILVCTGAADPYAPAEQVDAFRAEMQAAGAHAEVVSYPGAKHSFTNPEADGFAERFNMPLAYDAAADRDSWQRMRQLFDKAFSEQPSKQDH